MLWTDWGSNPKIEKASMDGSNRIILVNSTIMLAQTKTKIVWPNGLCIDFDTDTVYWVDAKSDVLVKMDLDGGKRK